MDRTHQDKLPAEASRTEGESLASRREECGGAEVRQAGNLAVQGMLPGAAPAGRALQLAGTPLSRAAAGLAGSAAAPAVFAAAGGGLLGGTAAVGAGAVAGSATGATLEFAGAAGGEALSMAVTPGRQEFDWGYAGERTAAGALAAPGLSNIIGNRLFGTGTAGLTSTGARLTVTAATGVGIGAPAGAGWRRGFRQAPGVNRPTGGRMTPAPAAARPAAPGLMKD